MKQGFILNCITVLSVFVMVLFVSSCSANVTELTLATTTSVNDSGLMDALRPVFEKDTNIKLKIISQGTGQAIRTGEDGNADILFIHAKSAEEKFVSDGYGLERIELAYNYYVIVGPSDDPAGLRGQNLHAGQALSTIADKKFPFVSRGDDSGTHKKESSLWSSMNQKPEGEWYVSAGKGMGDVLLMASEMKAYTLTDKATFLSMRDKLELEIVLEQSEDLLNQYTLIQVNPEKHPGINKKASDAFVRWITSDKALEIIDTFGHESYGESLFYVNYNRK